MAFSIPTLKESVQRVRQSFRANLPGSDAWIWPNNINPTAKVFGGIAHELFGFADYIQRQKFALTADTEGLDLHGEEYGLARRPAGPAAGRLIVSDATVVAAGARFRRTDGVEYIATTGGVRVNNDPIAVDVVASIDGKAANALAQSPLEILAGVTGDVASAIVDDGGIVGGVDVEDDEAFRARILFRKRNPPHGGAPSDYVMWASEVSGVTRVYVERRYGGVGTVRVFPMLDDHYPDGIPRVADVMRIADHIAMLSPAGALVNVAAPTPVPVDVAIAGLDPGTTPVREAVRVELRAAFRTNSRVAGTDSNIGSMPFLAYPTTFSQSWIWQAVANASGERRHRIVSPAADVALVPGQIAVLGNVTFQ